MSKSSSSTEVTCNFIPRELSTTSKETSGVSKTVFTHISTLYGYVNDWDRLREKGVKICRAILALKLYECASDYYPSQLKPLTESLVEALGGLRNVVEGVKVIEGQLQALAKLQPTEEAVILTWSTNRIADTVKAISDSIQKEYKLNHIITENIAHCRDENLIDVYVSSWELDPYFEPNAYLFAEVGLSVNI